ncbi:Trafficking protein particle complex 8 [Actinomortierella ambigua]|uniref:Trafficking protein particle complex 8 n=1 Tax=Actinomortierella ambigua TaxID=1343610 RepID=A0A9P6PX66_9FUNG|nr:Trafficking protein particle complex 8 [Actinomortierella ambigua]
MATRHLTGRDLVTRVFSPRVAIVASQGATELCQANHLPSVVDLFKPFGDRIDGRVMVHGSQGLPTAIDNLFLRFADIEQLDEPDHKARERWMAEVVRAQATVEPVPAEKQFPWYTEYCNLLLSTGGISDHETFDHPVACIIAISSLSTDPINEIHYLTNVSTPQAAFDKGYMDPTTLKYYVLIHDCRKGDLTNALELLEKMKRTFGLHCGILKINSSDPETPGQDKARHAHIWTKSVAHSKLLSLGRASTDSTLGSSSGGRDSVSSITSGSGSIVGASGTLSDLTLQRSSMSSPVYGGTGNSSPTFAHSQVYAYLGGEDDTASNTTLINPNALDIPVSKNVDLALDLLLHPERSAEPYGCCMSNEDISGISTFLREMVAQSIVPYMERNINHWNEQVAVSRRGIAGRFRRYFGSGSKPAGSVIQQPASSTSGGGIVYHHSSPEAHMRKLADWAFMLRDYKFAASTYDSVKKDFSSDKAWKYYGGTQEMIGLCTLMSGQLLGSKNEVDYYLESAVNSYIHKARSSFYACRATILYYELLKQKRMYKESPVSLTRMTAEASDLSNGILLEQAAFCYLKSSPRPQLRKFAFHMVMAGHRFYKAGQIEHAYRCYRTAADVYESKGWGLIDTHVSCALGRQMYQMGKPDDALEYYAKLLTESRQSPQQQAIYMREFLNVYREYTNKIESDPLRETFPDFPLPVVLGQTARVIMSTSEPANDHHSEPWLELAGETQKNTSASPAGDERVVSAVGEHVLVTLDIKNPLQIPLILTDIVLGCEHSTSTTSFTVPVDAAEEAHMVLYEQQNPTFSGRVVYTAFDIDRVDRLIMEPGETRTLQFEVLPKQEGQIRVMGLHCNVEGQVHAYKEIVKRGKRLNTTKEHMTSKMYAEDRSLNILVAPHMPLLDVAFHQTPEMMLSGEVCQLMLEVKNLGKKGLKNLGVRLSHPGFFCIGAEKDGDLGLYKSALGVSGQESIPVDNSLQDMKSQTVPLESGVLNPGERSMIPVWLRGDKIGRHQFLFLFTYESEQTGTAMRSRTLRHAIATQVLPSLKINAFTRPSTKGLNEFILGIETENLQTVAEFEFLQISSLSPGWIIETVDKSADTDDNLLISPRQTTFTYYRIRKDPALVPPAVSPEVFMAKALEKLVLGQERLKDTPPPLDLQACHLATRDSHIQMSSPVLRYLSQASRLGWRHGALAAQFSMIPSTVERKHLFTVYGTNDIDLALFWNIPKLNRRGHHYIIGINLGVQQNPYQPMPAANSVSYGAALGEDDDEDDDDEEKVAARRALYDQTMREQVALVKALTNNPHFRDESPVKILLRSADVVAHGSYATSRLCHTPVRVLVKNCSWNKHIEFTLEMLSSEDPMVPHPRGTAAGTGGGGALPAISSTTNPHVNAQPFFWSGPTITTSYLEPLQETEVVVLACFTAFGVYDINRWRLSVQVVKPMRKKRRNTKKGADADEDSLQPPALPQSIGKGFMQMPNLAHYIQVS